MVIGTAGLRRGDFRKSESVTATQRTFLRRFFLKSKRKCSTSENDCEMGLKLKSTNRTVSNVFHSETEICLNRRTVHSGLKLHLYEYKIMISQDLGSADWGKRRDYCNAIFTTVPLNSI